MGKVGPFSILGLGSTPGSRILNAPLEVTVLLVLSLQKAVHLLDSL